MRRQEDLPTLKSAWKRPAGALAVLAVLSMAALLAMPAGAQLAGKGAVTGTITDSSGAAIPGATVTLTNDATGVTLTVTSSGDGLYNEPALDPGIYTVTVTASGFQKLEQKNVHVNALESQTFSPKLQIGAETQTVTVDATPPQLETTNATLGATMEQELYSALPIEMGAYGSPDQRRATDFAFLMPGVQGNNTNGNPTTNTGVVNGSGSRGAVTAVYIDGLPFVRAGGNGDPRFVWTAISVDAVNQFQVQTNGYSAIYEGQGIQNYTIKQGGPKYHGSVYEFFRNTALDTWGFFGANPNPITGVVHKPVEHSNEFGINLQGPLLPVAGLRDKVFFFGNYNGFRFKNEVPTAMTFPTALQQAGNFQGALNTNTGAELSQSGGVGIYDPNSQAACTANSNDGPCRYRYGFVSGTGVGSRGNPVIGPGGTAAVDVIPASQFSAIAVKMQSYLPAVGTALQNNFISSNPSGLNNWSHTERVDVTLSQKNMLTFLAAIGRQASLVPQGQITAGRNVGPIPYDFGQAFTPKTAVGIIEDTYIVSPRIVNQIKYGYARYDGPTINANQLAAYSAATLGIANAPAGQAAGSFPIVTFAGTNAPTNWGGATANRVIAQNFTLLDNVQVQAGNHSVTVGAQLAWLNYDQTPASGGSTPITYAMAVTETAALNKSSNASPSYAATAATGLSYASFLVGQVDRTTFTQYAVQEFGSRFRAISPYIQDNWKVNSRLTLDLGLRYDFFPTMRENKDNQSFFNPTLTNPVTGFPGALQYAGNGTNTCNCSTPVNNYFKNFGPRIGMAYQIDAKTVLRASYGVMYTHGNGVGGGGSSVTGSANNSLGFSTTPTFALTGQLLTSAPLSAGIPTFAPALGRASGPAFGTGFTNVTGYTGTPTGMAYYDPYLGGRAPQYINWTLGLQHQWGNYFTSTFTYVGSEGHFLIADSSNARGFYSNQLDPKYLSLGSNLNLSGAALTAFCATNAGVCPAALSKFSSTQTLATLLRPFPFQGVADFFSNVSNANYHALQVSLNMRAAHGLTFMANYTWSRAIDDGGTFRSGYALPAGSVYNNPNAFAADRIERTVSTSSQPHHIVVTGVYELPFGKSMWGTHEWQRAVFGGYKVSEIFQAYSGSPLAITGASCGTNPAQSQCMASYNPAYTNPTNARINGKHWGQGVTRTNYTTVSFVDATAFTNTPAFQFGNTPRTAPYGLTGPGNYGLDLALVRSFKLHLGEASRFNFRAEWYNVTNHTKFAVASTQFGNSSFGQVTSDTTAARKSVQLSGRIEF